MITPRTTEFGDGRHGREEHMSSTSAGSGSTGQSPKGSRRSWILGFLGSVPQVLLATLLLLQGQGLSGNDAKVQSQLGAFAAAVFLFWSLIGCGMLALWSRTRPLAAALTWGASAGFVLAVVVAFAV
jgi:hypothetical protein